MPPGWIQSIFVIATCFSQVGFIVFELVRFIAAAFSALNLLFLLFSAAI
jgi:hypothetical protein